MERKGAREASKLVRRIEVSAQAGIWSMDFDLELVGAWSTESLYGDLEQSSRVVAFKNDGTGWFSSTEYGIENHSHFGWSPTSSGWVVMWETRHLEMLRGGRSRAIEKPLNTWHLPFSVADEEGLNHPEIEVLRIEIWSFGRNAFGLIEADSSKLQAPFGSTSS